MSCRLTPRVPAASLLLLLVCQTSVAGAGAPQWLRYHTHREAKRIVRDMSSVNVKVIAEAPKGLKLPAFKHAEPLFAKWATPMAKGGFVWMALDGKRKRGQHDRLIIDANGNGDLSDDEAVKAFSAHQSGAQFGPVRVVLPGEDGPVTYHLHARSYSQPNYRRLYIQPACWYEGDVRIGGKTWRCQLVDFNANGTFDDTSATGSQTDRIRIGTGDDFETHFVGKYVQVDGALYAVSPARDGAFVSLTPRTDVPMGTVQLTAQVTRFLAAGENGLFTVESADGTGRLPAGTYRLYRWELERKDERGALWKAQGSGSSKAFEIRKGKTTELAFGEPLTATVKATKTGATHRFDQSLRGSLGESVSLTRNGSRPSAPKLRITNAAGDYDKTFTFEYG